MDNKKCEIKFVIDEESIMVDGSANMKALMQIVSFCSGEISKVMGADKAKVMAGIAVGIGLAVAEEEKKGAEENEELN